VNGGGSTERRDALNVDLKMTPEEYLSFERAAEEKHEYVDGEIFAMSGASWAHSRIAMNIGSELTGALLDGPCAAVGSDVKIKAGTSYRRPDVAVVCGDPIFDDDAHDVVLNPKVVVEVLSDSTERYDRGDKFRAYGRIATVTDYILVSQKEVLVEHFHRASDGGWNYRQLGPGDELVLESVGCAIGVDAFYRKVFPAA
jgi:Uma2 family endonuclease